MEYTWNSVRIGSSPWSHSHATKRRSPAGTISFRWPLFGMSAARQTSRSAFPDRMTRTPPGKRIVEGHFPGVAAPREIQRPAAGLHMRRACTSRRPSFSTQLSTKRKPTSWMRHLPLVAAPFAAGSIPFETLRTGCESCASESDHRSTRIKMAPVRAAPQPQQNPQRARTSSLESHMGVPAKSIAPEPGRATSNTAAPTKPIKEPAIQFQSMSSTDKTRLEFRRSRPCELRLAPSRLGPSSARSRANQIRRVARTTGLENGRGTRRFKTRELGAGNRPPRKMRKRQKGSRMTGRKEPPLFWQTEFLQRVALVLFVMVSVAAAARLLTAFSRVGGF
jgi:hypothetical protein